MTTVVYNAPPTVGAFMRSDLFLRGLMGPFGSGKSVGCVMECLRRAVGQRSGEGGVRRVRAAIVRNTYPELRDTTRKTFEEWMPGARDPQFWSEQEFAFNLKLGPLPDGTSVDAEFLFRALDRPEHVSKLLSLELTFAWINEAREVPYSVVKMLTGRVGRYPSMRDGGPTWSGIFMDTNPPDDDSWWYRLFEEQRPANAAIFKQPGGADRMAENLGHWEDRDGACVGHYPREEHPGCRWVPHLAPGYYENLSVTNAGDPLFLKVHRDAQYGPTRDGKPVYPEFNEHVHVVTPEQIAVLPEAELLLGADFGLTPAVVIGQRDPRDGQVQWIDELVASDLGAVRFFEDVARHLRRLYPRRPVRGTGDPAGEARSQVDERTPFDIASAQGVPLAPAHTNDFTVRRDAVGRALTRLTLLGRPALVVSSRCRVLRKAMNGAYCLKRVAAPGRERFREVPDKNEFSHVAEAGQYLMLGEGEDVTALTGTTEHRRVRQVFSVEPCGVRRN